MKHTIFVFAAMLFLHCKAFATWSVILIDPKTKEIGIAGASCTYNCYGIGKIVPGMGAIIVQAMSNNEAREKGVEMILAEASPEQIIQALQDPAFDPEKQQYAVVTVKYFDNPRTYTGKATKTYNGALTANGVSVQGNTLTNENELELILAAVQKGRNDFLHIADVLMHALETGANAGGDKRCGEQRATSAFIIVAKPGDRKPFLNLNIFGQGKDGQNAVTMLRNKYEKWKRRHKL